MSARKKILSLKNQLLVFFGFLVLFTGLLFNFLSEEYPMFRAFKNLFIVIDSLGVCIIITSVFFAFYSLRKDLEKIWRSIAIETAMMFAFNFSLQATLFHLLFTYDLSPANLGVFYIFAAYFFALTALFMSFTDFLIKNYYGILLVLFTIVFFGTLASGIFLTFTGAIEPIIDNGMSLFIVGILSLIPLIIVYVTFPKWKSFLLEDSEEEEEEEKDEDVEDDENADIVYDVANVI